MLNQKSNSATRSLITSQDLAVKNYEANASEDVFPKIQFIKSGRVVMAVINGNQKANCAANTWKEYPIPADVKPEKIFSTIFQGPTLKNYQIEINNNNFCIRPLNEASPANSAISHCVTYLAKTLGGGGS